MSNDLALLEMGTRIATLERIVEEQANIIHLLVPVVATIQEQTYFRVMEMNKKNGH